MRRQAGKILSSIACLFCMTVVLTNLVNGEDGSHPYHVSMAEVNWNAKTRKFEVALCVWPADLEKALGQQEGRTIDLAKEPKVDQMMQAYIAKRFFIRGERKRGERKRIATAQSTDSVSKDQGAKPPVENSGGVSQEPASAAANGGQVAAKVPKASDPKAGDQHAKEGGSDEVGEAASSAAKSRESSRVKWYGHEADAKQAWLYFEIDGNLTGEWTFENRVFFELNDDQLNHIQWAGGGKSETLVVSPEKPRVVLATNALKGLQSSEAAKK